MSPRVGASEETSAVSDEVLMEQFRHGETRALEALYNRHAKSVHGFLVRMVRGDGALADDLLQQTFLSVVRSADRFEKGAKFWPWLLTIAANAARGNMRRVKLGVEVLGEEAPEPSMTPAHSDPAARKRIEAAFAKLPDSQREVVVLHKVEGLSFEEIAKILGITSTAARIRAHRGYEFLKAELGELV